MNSFERFDSRFRDSAPRLKCDFVGTALAIGLGIASAVGSTAASIYGANKQASAADNAAQLSYKAQEDALAYQKQKDAQSRTDLAPWLKAGTGAINSLSGMLSDGTFKDWTGNFTAPTNVTEQNDPGYQFRLQQGTQALERSAAARGGILSGGTAKAEQQFGQDYASNEYGNVYNRAYNEYATKYNEFNNNQTAKFNRYATVAGVGQNTANNLSLLGQQSANNTGSILLNGANMQGNYLQNSAYQRASGYNAAAGNISGLLQLLAQRAQPSGTVGPGTGGYG